MVGCSPLAERPDQIPLDGDDFPDDNDPAAIRSAVPSVTVVPPEGTKRARAVLRSADVSAPTALSDTVTENGIRFSWNAVPGSSVFYQVAWKYYDDGKWKPYSYSKLFTNTYFDVATGDDGWGKDYTRHYLLWVRASRNGTYSSWIKNEPLTIIYKCYSGSGYGDGSYRLVGALCDGNERWRPAYGISSGGLGIFVNSPSERKWVIETVANPSRLTAASSRGVAGSRIVDAFRCTDTSPTTTFVLYKYQATTGTHWYYGKASRRGFCSTDQVMRKRYPGGAKPGHRNLTILPIDRNELLFHPHMNYFWAIGYGPLAPKRAVVWHRHMVGAINDSIECLEQKNYVDAQARGELLTNAQRPGCKGRGSEAAKKPKNEQPCPHAGVGQRPNRSSTGVCRCRNNKNAETTGWDCPPYSNNDDDDDDDDDGGSSTPTCPAGQTWNGSECITPGCPPPSAGAPPGSCPFD